MIRVLSHGKLKQGGMMVGSEVDKIVSKSGNECLFVDGKTKA